MVGIQEQSLEHMCVTSHCFPNSRAYQSYPKMPPNSVRDFCISLLHKPQAITLTCQLSVLTMKAKSRRLEH